MDGTEDGMVEGMELEVEDSIKVDVYDADLPVRVSSGL